LPILLGEWILKSWRSEIMLSSLIHNTLIITLMN
jgi:hypothetical protein